MNSKIIFSAVSACFLTLLSACGGSGGGADVQPDHMRSFIEPRIPTNRKGNDIEIKNLGQSDLSSMLQCDDPSMSTRLDTKSFSTRLEEVSRRKDRFNLPVEVVAEELIYKTETHGQLFTSTYGLLDMSFDGVSALELGTYRYTDTCTLSGGCDALKRVFEEGDRWTMVMTKAKISQMKTQSAEDVENLNCQYPRDTEANEPVSIVNEVVVTLFGQDRLAAEHRFLEPVNVICDGVEVGKGTRVTKQIVLADDLPSSGSFLVSTLGGTSIGCPRTLVFEGEETRFNEEIHVGKAREITAYDVTGKIRTVEEWEAEKDNYIKTKAALENAGDVAESRVNQARSARDAAKVKVANKKTDLSEAIEDEQNAKIQLNNVKNDPDATTAQIQAAEENYNQKALLTQKVRITLEDAREELETAERAFDSAELSLRNAKSALAKFLAENPSN